MNNTEQSADFGDIEDATHNISPDLMPSLYKWHEETKDRAKEEGYAVLVFNGDQFATAGQPLEGVPHYEEWETVAEYYQEGQSLEIETYPDFIAGI